MSKKKKPAWLPNREDWAGRWGTAVTHYVMETKLQCDECLIHFVSTDLVYAFGNETAPTEPRFFLCAPCGYMALQSGNFPVATIMFISDEDRAKSYPDLSQDLKDKVVAAFQQIDAIHARVSELALKYGSANPKGLEGKPN